MPKEGIFQLWRADIRCTVHFQGLGVPFLESRGRMASGVKPTPWPAPCGLTPKTINEEKKIGWNGHTGSGTGPRSQLIGGKKPPMGGGFLLPYQGFRIGWASILLRHGMWERVSLNLPYAYFSTHFGCILPPKCPKNSTKFDFLKILTISQIGAYPIWMGVKMPYFYVLDHLWWFCVIVEIFQKFVIFDPFWSLICKIPIVGFQKFLFCEFPGPGAEFQDYYFLYWLHHCITYLPKKN